MSWQCAACLQTNPAGTQFCGHCGARATPATKQTPDTLAATMAELAGLLKNTSGEARERSDERRLITALFADVSGFTTLADRLDPEQLIERMDPILERMGQIVERYDGYVTKYAGDAILAFFGAPISHEDDAIRAVLAARDMHREIAEVVSTLPADVQHLTLHIGVNTGHVVTGFRGGQVRLDYSVLGDAVNVAQRLEAASSSGEVYVGETTYELARKALSFAPVGELVVKGKPAPVRAWRFVGADDEAPGVGLSSDGSATFGRDTELAAVEDALTAVRRGQSVLLALVGEPGVGKSRLLREARLRAEAAGMQWVAARCLSYGAGLPYRPYLDLVRQMADVQSSAEPDDVRAAVTALAGRLGLDAEAAFLVHAAGVSTAEIPPAIRENAQVLAHRMREALVAVLLETARRAPLVVAIEDLHWMDSASLEVTRQLAARGAELPLGLACTLRPEGRSAFDALGGDAGRARVVELSGLDRRAAAELAASILGGPIEPQTLDGLIARTGGNALFVQEVVRSLVDAGAFVTAPSGAYITAGDEVLDVPSTVESVLAARIDLLPREAADVLQVASVIGRDVRPALLRELIAGSSADLDSVIDLLVERQFIDRVIEAAEPRLLFHHALVADVAYGRLLRRQRQELHRRLVGVGLRLYGSGDDVIDLLARHAYLGGLGADALPYIVGAADRASAVFANAQAMTYLQQAIDIAEADARAGEQLPDLLLKLAELQGRTGRFEDAARTYRRVRDITDDAAAAIAEAAAVSRLDRTGECLELLEAVERTHSDLTADQHAQIAFERGRALAITGNVAEGIEICSHGIAGLVAAGEGGSVREAELRTMRARQLSIVGANSDALADLAIAVDILEAAGDLPRLATALRVLGGAQSDADTADEGIRTLERALNVARQVGHAEEIGACSINLGYQLWDVGRREEAIAYDEQAVAAFESMGLKGGVANAKVNMCDKLLDLERWDEARSIAEEALVIARDAGRQMWHAGALAVLSIVASAQADYPAAIDHAERAVAIYEAMGYASRASEIRQRADEARRLMAAD